MSRTYIFLALVIVSLFICIQASAQGTTHVDVLEARGPVTPALLSYIERGIDLAETDGAECLIIQLDTPGGSVDLTKEIIQRIAASHVPVVVYVAPRGAHAASAGTFIVLASHVAGMAPSTSIGAASPVSPGQELTGTEKAKLTNILVADIEGLARRRGEKAVEWAKKAVTEAEAATEEEALELGVIDFVAEDLDELLELMDGFEVKIGREMITLHTAKAEVKSLLMTPIENFLHTITNPNIAFILMTLGLNGLLFELSSPGGYLAGVVGSICLLLALYAFGVLSVNYTGFLFILLAFVLFLLDVKAPTHGVLSAGGIVAFIIGSLVLFNSPYYRVSSTLVISVALATGAFFAFVMTKALRAQQWQVATGWEGLIDRVAEVRTDLDPEGMVFLRGELWTAVAEDESVPKGEKVKVTAVDGFRLRVRRARD